MNDGVGDYTASLVAACSAENLVGHVIIYTGTGYTYAPIESAEIKAIFESAVPRSNRRLVGAVMRDQPEWLILQYSPFGFGYRGFNLHLSRVLSEIRQKSNTHVAVMFHERYVKGKRWQAAVMGVWQRWQFYQLGKAADAVFFSVESWALAHRNSFGKKPVVHLPVGSAMPRVAIDRLNARSRLGIKDEEIVLGVFGSAHISRQFHLIRAAGVAIRQQGKRVRVLYVGADGEQVKLAIGDLPSITDGPHPSDEVSKRLAAMDIYMAPYSDGVSTRRSAMMAAMQHGLPIVGTSGEATDAELLAENGISLLLTPPNDQEEFAKAVTNLAEDKPRRDELARSSENLFQTRYSWPVIASRMMSVLTQASELPK